MKYPVIHTMEQGTDEWLAIRLGLITASNFATAIAKSGSSTRATLMRKLVAERLTGLVQSGYKNANMERGNELEPAAREYYELLHDVTVNQIGFVQISEDIGISPDGLVGEDGGIEIKCPLPSTHIDYIIKDKLPSCYRHQVHGCMWATGRKWIDFVSYCPEVKDRPYWAVRVVRDEKEITTLQVKVEQFVAEMNQMLAKITEGNF